MPQFKQYDSSGQKTKEEALAAPLGQAIQSLPALWMAHKLEKEKMALELQKLAMERSKLQAEHGALTKSGELVSSLPGMTPQGGEKLSPDMQLKAYGTEGYKALNPAPTTIMGMGGLPPQTVPGRVVFPPVNPVDREAQKQQAKLDAEKPKAVGSFNNTVRGYDKMIKEAEDILNDPDLGKATGYVAGRVELPGGAKRVASRIETLKNKTLLNVLQQMKELSKNGASGFGQLNTVEGESIKNSISSLNRTMDTPDFKASLERFIDEIKSQREGVVSTFNSTYGETPLENSDPLGIR